MQRSMPGRAREAGAFLALCVHVGEVGRKA